MKSSFYQSTGKRIFDILAAAAGLLILSPLLALLTIAVKLSSPGLVFYRQQRVGRNGVSFRIVKFRSMYVDADRHGLAITAAGDARVTSIGRVLRRFKLDELPQLWNVLVGEMSLVGPRPEVPRYLECYSPAQRRVLTVRPGITDPASLLYRDEESILASQPDTDRYYREVVLPDKLNLNLEYLSRSSFRYDLSLILQTVGRLVWPASGRRHLPVHSPESSRTS
jgi:lipopolysaccharide/colanic/teichoic acid biosynthesis glycosyltransferase